MFDDLTRRLNEAFKGMLSRGVLTEADVDAGLREVRLALLEADVNFKVARDFIARVREQAVGEAVLKSVTPGQQVVKIVHDELVELLGGENAGISYDSKPPTVIMTLGLQGSGKTTSAAKLAILVRKQGHHPVLVGADVHRPAARDQLEVLAKQADVPYFSDRWRRRGDRRRGRSRGRPAGYDVVIIDTAGRLQLDREMLDEVRRIRDRVKLSESLLVVDAMTGQEAVNVAQTFEQEVGVDGVVMTKMDGDARGGAALSLKATVGQAHPLRRAPARSSTTWSCFIPTGWRRGSWAWATSSRWSSAPRRPSARKRPRQPRRSWPRASSPSTTWLPSFARFEGWGRWRASSACSPGATR